MATVGVGVSPLSKRPCRSYSGLEPRLGRAARRSGQNHARNASNGCACVNVLVSDAGASILLCSLLRANEDYSKHERLPFLLHIFLAVAFRLTVPLKALCHLDENIEDT